MTLKGQVRSNDESTRAFAHEQNIQAPESTATGVTTGGVIGGTLRLLAGIGALAIPGVAPLICWAWVFQSMRQSATRAQ